MSRSVELRESKSVYRALGQWSYRNWKAVLAAWVVVFVGVGVASAVIKPAFDSSFEIPASESRDGFDVLEDHFGGTGSGQPGSIVFTTERGVDDPAVVALMNELFDYTVTLDEGLQLVSPYAGGPQPQIAFVGEKAGKIAYADITVSLDVDQVEAGLIGEDIRTKAAELLEREDLNDDLQIEVGGAILGGFEPPQTELIGLAFAVVVLILAFGSVLAMGLPVGVAVAGVGTGIGIISILSNLISMPDFALQIGAMIGLGVGIDYALFIVTRYRTSLAAGYSNIDSVGIALDTAGRSVIFAGLTVVVSLLGMLLIGLSFITGLGIGAASTVAVTMVASVTLLPALLGLVGNRINVTTVRGLFVAGCLSLGLLLLGFGVTTPGLIILAVALVLALVGRFIPTGGLFERVIPPRADKPIRETLAYRWSRVIQGHPWLSLLAGATILLILAAPVLKLRMGFSDEGNFPEETSTRKAYDLIAEGFGPGFNGPLLVTALLDSPASMAQAQAQELQAAIAATPGIASASPTIPDDPDAPEAVLIQVIPETAPQDAATDELVKTLRDDVIPTADEGLTVAVTGAVPANIDFTSFLGARILIFFGVVLTLSFLLLMAVFRSLIVPIKAVIMNVLSIASAYGIIVAIFQWGWLGDLFGITGAPIEPFIPMMLFAIVFGLSMDYEVFLLSRVKEEYERTGDAQNSVADGLASTARVITAAAAIMIVVFGSFMFEDNRIIKLFGLGLGLAVFLDATLVRMLLVPATMELLGERNWWLPRWLDRLIPNLNIEGTEMPALPTVGSDEQPEPDQEPALT